MSLVGDLEARLREALSEAAPESLPTIGVREKLVSSIHERRRRKQQLFGGIAAACVIFGGIAVGIAAGATHTDHSSNLSTSAAPIKRSAGPLKATAAAPNSSDLPRPDCAEATIGTNAATGCWGTYSRTSSGSVDYSLKGNESEDASGTSKALTRSHTARNLEIVVPLGQPVTIDLPGVSGKIWTAPAIAPGQGAGAQNVQKISEKASSPGGSASATFESRTAVTVVVEASSFAVCGTAQTPCGDQVGTWSMVIEFQAT